MGKGQRTEGKVFGQGHGGGGAGQNVYMSCDLRYGDRRETRDKREERQKTKRKRKEI